MAEDLKNEGNGLFQKRKYKAAYDKYTEAIGVDGENAIYYANRAACSLSLKEYIAASSDARKATQLDPHYAKAWARLGSAQHALELWDESIEAWRRAITCLPPGPGQFTETDKKLGLQFSEGLEKAEAALRRAKGPEGRAFLKTDITLPWQRAEPMLERLQKENRISSAFVISYAYREFKKGVESMKMLAQTPTPSGQKAWVGQPGALVDISNGLMRDPRVFHIDCPDWSTKYNQQVEFELQFFEGWENDRVRDLINELPKKLKQDGWDKTRKTLAVTVRAWIISGLVASASGKAMLAVEQYSRVLEVLDWGSRVWKDIPTSDRGCVFERTFIRGIIRLHVMAIHKILARRLEDSPYTRVQLAEKCHELVAETDAHSPTRGADIGFFMSFWVYPKAEALAILGWCYIQIGLEAEDAETALTAFGEAAEFYKQASICLPRDEEKMASFLYAGLEACWFGNKKLEDILFFVIWLQQLNPDMKEIWEHSPTSVFRDERLEAATNYSLACAKGKLDGRFDKSSIVKPVSMKHQDRWATPNVIYI